jgi:SAM-dependent methyltransferase
VLKSFPIFCGLLLLAACGHTEKKVAHGGHEHHHGHHHHAHHGTPAGGQKCHTSNHRFRDPARWSKVFDNPKRDAWQKPDAVVAKLALAPTASIADIGAGTGYFSMRFAKAVPQGKVFAIDLEQTLLEHIKKRAAKAGLEQRIQTVQASATDANVPQAVDVIFLCNTYHHIGQRVQYFAKLKSKLNKGGRIVVVDYKGGELPMGPPESHRVLPEALQKELESAGYQKVAVDRETLPYQYIAIFRLP